MEGAQKTGHGDGCCNICPGQLETNEHIFFTCSKARRGWAANAIYYEESPQESALVDATSIIDIVDDSLHKTPHDTTRLFVIYHTCWSLWNHCNNMMYSTQRPQFSPRIIVDQAREHIVVATQYYTAHKKKDGSDRRPYSLPPSHQMHEHRHAAHPNKRLATTDRLHTKVCSL